MSPLRLLNPHTLSPGDRVTVSSDNETFNGTFAVGGTTETTFTYQIRVFHITPLQVAVTGSMRGVSETHLPDARYLIPTENEWYKAAYYDPSPEGPADHYWLFPWRSDNTEGRRPISTMAPMRSTAFIVTGDDGARLYFSGAKVIDGWKDQSATTYTYTTTLTAGALYNIELHFYEREGEATCRLHWSYPGQTEQAIPQSQLLPPSG